MGLATDCVIEALGIARSENPDREAKAIAGALLVAESLLDLREIRKEITKLRMGLVKEK